MAGFFVYLADVLLNVAFLSFFRQLGNASA